MNIHLNYIHIEKYIHDDEYVGFSFCDTHFFTLLRAKQSSSMSVGERRKHRKKSSDISLPTAKKTSFTHTKKSTMSSSRENSMKFIWHEYWIMVKCILVCHGLSTPQCAVYLLLFFSLLFLTLITVEHNIQQPRKRDSVHLHFFISPVYSLDELSSGSERGTRIFLSLVYGVNVNLIQPKKELMEKLCRSIKSHKLT